MEAGRQAARFTEQVERWPAQRDGVGAGATDLQLAVRPGVHLAPLGNSFAKKNDIPLCWPHILPRRLWPGLSESRPKPTRRLVSSASKSKDDSTLQTKTVLIVIDASVKRTAIGKAGVEILSLDSAQGDIPVQFEVKPSTDRQSKSI